jgi:Tol biopolymer transport system component
MVGSTVGRRIRWMLAVITAATLLVVAVTSVESPVPTSAQVTNEPAEVVSRLPGGGGSWGVSATGPVISADGRIVAFNSSRNVVGAGNIDTVAIRDRIADTTVQTPRVPSYNPGISDDGCIVTYSANEVFGEFGGWHLYFVNRCNGASGIVNPLYLPNPAGSAALNADGTFAVVSVGGGFQVYARNGNVWALVNTAPAAGAGAWNIAEVAVSDDGNVVAFSGRPASVTAVLPFNIYVWDRRNPTAPFVIVSRQANGQGGNANSFGPSINGAGNLVAFESLATNLSGGNPSGNVDTFVLDRSNNQMFVLNAGSEDPQLSRDGRHASFTLDFGEIGEIFARTTVTGAFSNADLVSYTLGGVTVPTGGDAARSAISGNGRWVAFDSYAGSELTTDQRFHNGFQVWVRERPPVLRIDALDFGVVNVGQSAERTTTITNVGLSQWVFTGFDTTAGFSLVGETCPAAIDPGGSCQATVRFAPAGSGPASGTLNVRDNSYPAKPLVAFGSLRGAGEGGGTVTNPTVPTTTTTPGTPPPPGAPSLVGTPSPLTFDQTVAGVASAAGQVTIRNNGTVDNQVESLAVEGGNATDFAVTGTTCNGVNLAPNATCTVDVTFTPTSWGDRIANLVARGRGGSSATVALAGNGVYRPTLEVLPPVASSGQVVSIIGSGFPPNFAVDVTWTVSPQTFAATTDASGVLRIQALVLAVGSGPRTVTATAVPGVYDGVPAEMLVVPSPMRPRNTTSVFRGASGYLSR